MKLHRDLDVTQTTAWFMLQRIREGLIPNTDTFAGPVEVDEAYFGGLEKNKHASKKANLGRGPVDKTAVVGMKDRESNQVTARVIQDTDGATLNAFVDHHSSDDPGYLSIGSASIGIAQSS